MFHPSRDDTSMLVLTNTLEQQHEHKVTIRFVETSQATQSKQLHSVSLWCEQSCTTYSTEKKSLLFLYTLLQICYTVDID